MNLVIVKSHDEFEKNRFKLKDHRAWHITNILKAKAGSTVEIGQLNGPKGSARVVDVNEKEVILECDFESQRSAVKHQPIIDIICALPRPQTLKDLLQSAATMGVRNIHLINSNKVEVCYFSASVMQPSSIEENLLKGLSQGKLTMIPKVHIHKRFKVFFSQTIHELEAKENMKAQKILLDTDARNRITSTNISDCGKYMLAIGPESGWVPFELEFMKKHGFTPFKLGPWPLRVENALVAALGQLETALI